MMEIDSWEEMMHQVEIEASIFDERHKRGLASSLKFGINGGGQNMLSEVQDFFVSFIPEL